MARSRTQQLERMLGHATRFLDEVRGDIGRAARDGEDIPPRLRSVHERQGHATPEFRTMAIPLSDGACGASPEVLAGAIAQFAARKRPDGLLLAIEAEMDRGDGNTGPVLIAEVRDRGGTRMYWMQPYRPNGSQVDWDDPLEGGWRDPGGEAMILDAAFELPVSRDDAPDRAVSGRRRRRG